MKSLFGEPIGNYITRTRVEAAALLIRYTQEEIQVIAQKVGYNTPSSLNKKFKQFYNISPSEYRKNQDLTINKVEKKSVHIKLKPPLILDLPTKEVIYILIKGEYGKANYAKAWDELGDFAKENKLFFKNTESFGITYDEPSVTPKEKCRYEACITIDQSVTPKGEIDKRKIEGGKFAVFKYQGNYENWGLIYDYIYDVWLINSNYGIRNQAVMEKYLTTEKQDNETALNLEIYLPIQ